MTDELTTDGLAQHLQSLARANEVRTARSADKKAIRRRELHASTVLRSPPVHWQRATLVELLLCVPRVGRVKAQRWCTIERVKLDARLINLTIRQRELMARHVDFHLRDDRWSRRQSGNGNAG
jgi:hypothetical protein